MAVEFALMQHIQIVKAMEQIYGVKGYLVHKGNIHIIYCGKVSKPYRLLTLRTQMLEIIIFNQFLLQLHCAIFREIFMTFFI